MPIVNYNGVDQEYHLLLPWQKTEYAEAQALELAARRPVHLDENQMRADAAMRSLPHEAKLSLRRAGYQGDLSALPPGPNSYKLAKSTIKTKAGHVVDEYVGDPRAWMDQFTPPVRMRALSFRGPNQSDESWHETCVRRFNHWQERNPDKVGHSAHTLMIRE